MSAPVAASRLPSGSFEAEPLLRLGQALQQRGYRFTTVTPATHARVNARAGQARAGTVEDVFGWSRPFRPEALPTELVDLMAAAGVLEPEGADSFRSTVRASTLASAPWPNGEAARPQLYFHSAYPTAESDAIFFGPDTYRFAAAIGRHLATAKHPIHRAVDIGCGAGPGAITVALARPHAEVMAVDINERALRHTRINASLAGAANVEARRSNLLHSAAGEFDLIVANPPYLLDPAERIYRHGGGGMGEGLSLAIAELAATRLAPGGSLLLYTGSAVCNGIDRFHDLARSRLAGSSLSWTYQELDPDVFGEELLEPAYANADRIAAVLLTVKRPVVEAGTARRACWRSS